VGALALSTAATAGRALIGLTMALATAGCTAGSSAVPSSSPVGPTGLSVPASNQSAPNTSSAVAAAAVLRQYEAFWRALPAASAAPSDTARLAALFDTTTTPEISQLVGKLGAQRAAGEVLYGWDLPHAKVAAIVSGSAKITDCQDSSNAGVREMATGRKLTVGVARHPVMATMLLRGAAWKVSTITYPPSGSAC